MKLLMRFLLVVVVIYSCKKEEVAPETPETPETPLPEFELVKANAGLFKERNGHQVVGYMDKMWLIGGLTDDGIIGDVWSSGDGAEWSEVGIIGDKFEERSGHQVLTFSDKMWIIGGLKTDRITSLDDVWYSSNGSDWTSVVFEGTHFAGRYSHQSIVFKDKMWVIGGKYKEDIWSSSNGAKWDLIVENAPFGVLEKFQLVTDGDYMYVLSGTNGDDYFGNVWRSEDGVSWTKIVGNNDLLKRARSQVVYFDEQFWQIGGEFNNSPFEEVYVSDDGITWEKANVTGTLFSARFAHQTVVFDDTIWVIAGYDGENRLNEVWKKIK